MAAAGHGIARVEDEVEERGLDLVGIGQGRPQLGGELLADLDMLAHGTMQQVVHADDDLIEVDRLRAQLLAAREGEELLRQLLGAARRQRGRSHQAQQARLVAELALEQLEIAGDHREHVVEVVSDAAGELAHRLHLLRLTQRVLDAPPLGRLAQEADAADHLAAAAVERREEAVVIALASALGDGVALVVERRLAAVERAAHRRLADGADEVGQDVENALPQHAVDGHSGDALHARVPQRDAELAVEHDDALGAALDEEFRELLLAPQRLLGKLVRGNVEMHHHCASRAADDERRRHEAVPAAPAALVAGMVDAELRQPPGEHGGEALGDRGAQLGPAIRGAELEIAAPDRRRCVDAAGHGEVVPAAAYREDVAVLVEQRDMGRERVEDGRLMVGELLQPELAFAQPLLGVLSRGRVAQDGDPVRVPAVGVRHRRDIHLGPELAAVLAVVDHLDAYRLPARQRGAHPLAAFGIRARALQEVRRAPEHVLLGIAGHDAEGAVDVDDTRCVARRRACFGDHHGVIGVQHHRLQQRDALLHLLARQQVAHLAR